MPAKTPWEMLSSEEQGLYRRLCLASHKAYLHADQALKRLLAPIEEPGRSSSGEAQPEVNRPRPDEIEELKAKCEAAHEAYLYLLKRYPEADA